MARSKHENDETAPTHQEGLQQVDRRPPGRDTKGGDMSGIRTGRSRGEKMSLYIPGEVLADIRAEARRQQRSVSWLIRQAWRLARKGMDALPAAQEWNPEEGPGALPNS